MPFATEPEMYPAVCEWLQRFLKDRHPKAQVRVFDASRASLARLIKDQGLVQGLPPEWPSWDIHVDIVGFLLAKGETDLAFVECKNTLITLAHLSQILGYSRVAKPRYSFIVSPYGASDALASLLLTFHRIDVLEYHHQPGKLARSIVVAKWDECAKSIDYGSVIAADGVSLGRLR